MSAHEDWLAELKDGLNGGDVDGVEALGVLNELEEGLGYGIDKGSDGSGAGAGIDGNTEACELGPDDGADDAGGVIVEQLLGLYDGGVFCIGVGKLDEDHAELGEGIVFGKPLKPGQSALGVAADVLRPGAERWRVTSSAETSLERASMRGAAALAL